jgi:hypothetical protein
MGYTEGLGKFLGMAGALEYGQYVEGALVQLGRVAGMDNDTRQHIYNSFSDWEGSVIEVKAAGRDKNSLALIEPRFIRRRYDKRGEECTTC